jgi:short chain dehydrogenase
MASLTKKTALVTGASRGIGRATASALAEAGAHVLEHYAAPGRKQNLSWPASALKGDARMRSGRTWELRTEQHCWPRKFARLSASAWMCSCLTPGSARRRRSKVIVWRTLTIFLQRMSELRFSWCEHSGRRRIKALRLRSDERSNPALTKKMRTLL